MLVTIQDYDAIFTDGNELLIYNILMIDFLASEEQFIAKEKDWEPKKNIMGTTGKIVYCFLLLYFYISQKFFTAHLFSLFPTTSSLNG